MGPFQLKNVIGRGGMGTVYHATHNETGESVAVKALSPTYSHDTHFRGRFESEIEALIRLDHPNIVRLLSYGQEDGNLYFAMELVEGKSLFHLQKECRRFHWRDVLRVASDVASGLRHAHDRGVIHRDLKPGNLLRDTDGTIKITDFGIAKQFGANNNTQDNVLGTLDFMSPEQAKGQPVTVRSDLFSLGVVLYTLLAGKTPFAAKSMDESLRNLTSTPPASLAAIVPGLPDEIEELIFDLMEKKPEDRIPTSQALLHKLNSVESVLKNHSEAKTAHGDQPPPKDHHSGTKTISDRSATEGGYLPTQSDQKRSSSTLGGKTVEIGSRDEVGEDFEFETTEVEQKPDYFNTVTDAQRRRRADQEDRSSLIGALPLLAALILVIGLASWGMWRAFQPTSADDLYEKIAENVERPDRVRSEISEFLENYPEDERADEIKRLDDIAMAIAYFNRMSVRGNMSGENRLSKMEQEFVKIVGVSKNESVEGFSQLYAFVTLHEQVESKSDADKECLQAAKNYLIKLRNDAMNDIDWRQDLIDEALRKAKNLEKPEQIRILRSIIELYGDVKVADSTIENVKKQLELLEQQ